MASIVGQTSSKITLEEHWILALKIVRHPERKHSLRSRIFIFRRPVLHPELPLSTYFRKRSARNSGKLSFAMESAV